MSFNPGGIVQNTFKNLGLQSDAPELQKVDLDPDSKALLNSYTNKATQSVGDYANDNSKGITEQAMSLGQSPQNNSQETKLGIQPGMYDALRNVYNQQAGDSINKLKQTNEIQSNITRSENMRKAAAFQLGQQQAITNNYAALTQVYNQNEAARAQFVASLTGAANTYIGYNARNARRPVGNSVASGVNLSNSGSAGQYLGTEPSDVNYGSYIGSSGLNY